MTSASFLVLTDLEEAPGSLADFGEAPVALADLAALDLGAVSRSLATPLELILVADVGGMVLEGGG